MMKGPQFNHSYFVGYDESHGWGNTTYFTFFSEFNRPWKGLAYIEAFILILLFLASILVNLLIFYQILHIKSTRTVTNYLMCNLAITDVLFSCGGPFVAIARLSGTWILGQCMCKMLVYIMFVCSSVMIWTMTIMSIDRYICINKVRARKMTPRVAVAVIFLIWFIDFIIFIPLALYFNEKEFSFGYSSVHICTLMWPNMSNIRFSVMFTSLLCIIAYIIPFIIIFVNYIRILKRFWSSRRAIMSIHNSVRRVTSDPSSKRIARDIRDFNVVKTLVLVVVLFIVMWTPIFVIFVAIQLDGMEENMKLPSQALIATLGVAMCNACVNPFVYGVMNSKIKSAVVSCLSCKKKANIRDSKSIDSVAVKAVSYSNNSANM